MEKFQHIVEINQSAIFIDEKTQAPLVMVICDFIWDPAVLSFFNEVIKDNVGASKAKSLGKFIVC
jgi:hypothetical protein